MHDQAWKTAKKAVHVDLRIFLYGVVAGILVGASRLGTSVEEATAFCIATLVEVTVGTWLGIELSLAGLRLVKRWVDSLEERVDSLTLRFGIMSDASGDRQIRQPEPATLIRLTFVKWCILVTPVGVLLLTLGGITGLIDFRSNIYAFDFYIIELMAGVVITFVGFLGQCVYLWEAGYRIARCEGKLDMADSIDDCALSTRQLGTIYNSTSSIIYKLTGAKLAA